MPVLTVPRPNYNILLRARIKPAPDMQDLPVPPPAYESPHSSLPTVGPYTYEILAGFPSGHFRALGQVIAGSNPTNDMAARLNGVEVKHHDNIVHRVLREIDSTAVGKIGVGKCRPEDAVRVAPDSQTGWKPWLRPGPRGVSTNHTRSIHFPSLI